MTCPKVFKSFCNESNISDIVKTAVECNSNKIFRYNEGTHEEGGENHLYIVGAKNADEAVDFVVNHSQKEIESIVLEKLSLTTLSPGLSPDFLSWIVHKYASNGITEI